MNEYYFTFGPNHTDKKNRSLKDCFTTIKAHSAEEARKIMFDKYGNRFAFQYESAYQAGVEKYALTYVPFDEIANKHEVSKSDTSSLF